MSATKRKKLEQGVLIVLEGLDGSGKATQAALLTKNLKQAGYSVKQIDFPQYYDNFMGKFLGECLVGEHGDWANLDPYIASVIYATDRFESRDKIINWLQQGYIVISDRYVTSNKLYQAGKAANTKTQAKILKWLDHLEYELFKLPKPNLVIYLDVPVTVSMQLSQKHDNQEKIYSNGQVDVHERNVKLQERVRKSALGFVSKQESWQVISCVKQNNVMLPEDIAQKVLNKVLEVL